MKVILSRTGFILPTFLKRKSAMGILVLSGLLAEMNANCALIATWDFTGENSLATSTADVSDLHLDNAPVRTRGSGAAASTGANSFRTTGFQNNGIATANSDYFQTAMSAASGYTLTLSSIDARFFGTDTFARSSGVIAQFAYSLDGSSFALIGSPFALSVVASMPSAGLVMPQIDLSGISALQNVSDSKTVTIRYYASGQTTSGGWGFFSSGAGVNGLAFGGAVTAVPVTLVPEPSTFITGALLALPLGINGVSRCLRNRKRN